jgi:hypothetical protein
MRHLIIGSCSYVLSEITLFILKKKNPQAFAGVATAQFD